MSQGAIPSLLELIGGTPLVALGRLSPPGRTILAKLESRNPGGSVKDRVVRAILESAVASGELLPGGTVVEASAGNLGVSLAMLAAVQGYRAIVVMPESVSPEQRRLLLQMGAQVVLTPAAAGMAAAVEMAQQICRREGYLHLNAFYRQENLEAHRRTTAVEILEATGGKLDAFVCGVGTGGTITGVGEVLKERLSGVKVVAVEPERSPLLSRGWWGQHSIPGLGASFRPPLLNQSILDEVVTVSDEAAVTTALALSREEGLLVGISSGANVWASVKIAQGLVEGARLVTILPDSGERYLNQMFTAAAMAETAERRHR